MKKQQFCLKLSEKDMTNLKMLADQKKSTVNGLIKEFINSNMDEVNDNNLFYKIIDVIVKYKKAHPFGFISQDQMHDPIVINDIKNAEEYSLIDNIFDEEYKKFVDRYLHEKAFINTDMIYDVLSYATIEDFEWAEETVKGFSDEYLIERICSIPGPHNEDIGYIHKNKTKGIYCVVSDEDWV